MTIFIGIRKKYHLDDCPACNGNKLTDVSNITYPNMFECDNCGIITQVKFDG